MIAPVRETALDARLMACYLYQENSREIWPLNCLLCQKHKYDHGMIMSKSGAENRVKRAVCFLFKAFQADDEEWVPTVMS